MSDLIVSATFTKNSGDAATGLTLADIDLYLTAQNIETGADAVVWDGTQNPTEEIDNIGIYARIYASADFDTNVYYARATYTGATTLDVDTVTGGSDANVWLYATRTLTQSAASVTSAVTGDEVTVYRGTYWEVTLTGLPDLTDRTEVYLAVKVNKSDTDDEAIALWSLGTGLERFDGQAVTASEGALTVPTSTSVKVILKANTTQDAPILSDLWYGVKRIAASGEAYASSEGGTWDIVAETPRAVT